MCPGVPAPVHPAAEPHRDTAANDKGSAGREMPFHRGRDGAFHSAAGRVRRGAARPDICPADGLARSGCHAILPRTGRHGAVRPHMPKRLRPGTPHPGDRTSGCGSGSAMSVSLLYGFDEYEIIITITLAHKLPDFTCLYYTYVLGSTYNEVDTTSHRENRGFTRVDSSNHAHPSLNLTVP